MRVCTKCNIPQSADQFYKKKDGRDGLSAGCKSCRRRYYEDNILQEKAASKRWIDNNRSHFNILNRRAASKRMKVDEEYRITRRCRHALANWKRRGRPTPGRKCPVNPLLGYNANDFLDVVEQDILKYGIYAAVDHKIPLSWFKPGTSTLIVHDLRNIRIISFQENDDKKDFYPTPVEASYLSIIKPHIKDEYLCW